MILLLRCVFVRLNKIKQIIPKNDFKSIINKTQRVKHKPKHQSLSPGINVSYYNNQFISNQTIYKNSGNRNCSNVNNDLSEGESNNRYYKLMMNEDNKK